MLNRVSRRLDLQEIRLPEEPIDVDAGSVCDRFGPERSPQAPEGAGMVDSNTEWAGKLCIGGFNHADVLHPESLSDNDLGRQPNDLPGLAYSTQQKCASATCCLCPC